MERFDVETVLICAVVAVMGTFGVVAGVAAFAGIRFQECNAAVLTGICCGISGVVWGILLICSRNQWVKKV